MECRFSRIAALGALIVLSWAGQMATMAGEPGRLAALAARQDLYDEVCIARADGKISPASRCTILADAKQILTPQEYESFKKALNRLSPPPPAVAKHAAIKRLPKVAEKKVPATRGGALVKTVTRPVIPCSALQPDRLADRVALTGGMR
jgi:hypothetical protein